MKQHIHRSPLRLNLYRIIALVACVSIGYQVHLFTRIGAHGDARRADLTTLLHLDDNGAFSGDSECAFHFIWALAWSQGVLSEFSSTLTPTPSHCTSFPHSYNQDAALQARALIMSPSSCISILKLLVPLPSLHSSIAQGSYACWHLKYMARHFALMRRVAEAPAPAGSPKTPLVFNVSAVLRLIPKGPSDSESKCELLQGRDKSLDLRCCLEDEACVRHHASQLTWVGVPQLLRVFVSERQSAHGFVDSNEVDEMLLLDTLQTIKTAANPHEEHETHKLWTTFVTMSVLLPHKRRLRSVQLDHALQSVTKGQSPGSKFAIFSEFSRCGSPTVSRYGMRIAENLRANIKQSWGSEADVIFATFDPSCSHEGVTSQSSPHPLPFVLYSRITAEGLVLAHCSRDMDSVTRAMWTWEIIKRGVSVVNTDPDVFFFRPIPSDYFMDSSMALTSYTSSQLVFCDACEQPQHLQCLGLNTVNAHLHGPAVNSLLYASILTDVAGAESFDFFGQDGKARIGYCDEGSSSPQYCNELKHSRWAAWRCDDQFAFYKIRDSMLQAGVVRALRSGPHKETLINSTGYLTLRVLSSSEFAMARTWLRGHRTGNEIALHMATFIGDKVNGLREEQLWLVDPPSYFTGSFVELSQTSMSAARSLDEEKQLLLLLLRFGTVLNRTVILPSFKCEFTPVVNRGSWGWPFRTLWDKVYAIYDEWGMEGSFRNRSRWQTINGDSSCAYYFHFDYRALESAGIAFRPSSFFKSFDRFSVPPGEDNLDALHGQRSSVVPVAVVLKSFQDLLSLSKVPLPLTPSAKHDFTSSSVPKTAASRLILDWDLLNDSPQLCNLMGVFSASEIASILAATQMSFGI
jgi:hypothetical protein